LDTKWSIEPSFTITLHKRDLLLLNLIQATFGVGRVLEKNKDVSYTVWSIKDITNVIIPHFDKYPLLTQKRVDFLLFKSIVELINRKEHLTEEGLIKIVNIKASLNNGLSDKLKTIFPNAVPVPRVPITEPLSFDPNWVAGFIEAEGCFNIRVSLSKGCKAGYQV